jgi:hypothetical protein
LPSTEFLQNRYKNRWRLSKIKGPNEDFYQFLFVPNAVGPEHQKMDPNADSVQADKELFTHVRIIQEFLLLQPVISIRGHYRAALIFLPIKRIAPLP